MLPDLVCQDCYRSGYVRLCWGRPPTLRAAPNIFATSTAAASPSSPNTIDARTDAHGHASPTATAAAPTAAPASTGGALFQEEKVRIDGFSWLKHCGGNFLMRNCGISSCHVGKAVFSAKIDDSQEGNLFKNYSFSKIPILSKFSLFSFKTNHHQYRFNVLII